MLKGRIVEIFVPEGSGKTTFALHVIAKAQKKEGLMCIYQCRTCIECHVCCKFGANAGCLVTSQLNARK
ncbi:hypothetical protein [Wolbachia endosymbiont of Litomosoides brasiliensis]|uniref:hypothetical protein n=1 Tax=Wolbachia endosymbiont of Litomosoides brasiliensis TaxID=1812117 RepID=UPI0034E24644